MHIYLISGSQSDVRNLVIGKVILCTIRKLEDIICFWFLGIPSLRCIISVQQPISKLEKCWVSSPLESAINVQFALSCFDMEHSCLAHLKLKI